MSDEWKQDFDGAMIKHLLFKSRLRSFLYGRPSGEAILRDPQLCELGRWIEERALRGPYRHLPESQVLDQAHRRIHQLASQLMDLYQRGQTEQALAGLVQVQPVADQITALLRTMEEKVRAGA